jgi:hypothetical protein
MFTQEIKYREIERDRNIELDKQIDRQTKINGQRQELERQVQERTERKSIHRETYYEFVCSMFK